MVAALKTVELLGSVLVMRKVLVSLTTFPFEAPWFLAHQAEQDFFALSDDDLLKQSLEHLDFKAAAHLCFHFGIAFKQSRKAV